MRIISRNSNLAIRQVEEVMKQFPLTDYSLVTTESFGDRHKEVSLMDKSVAPDFFTRELDAALLDGRADIAIHSAKDLPYPLPPGIEVIALTKSADKSDSLVSHNGLTLSQMPSGSRIGTSSEQRKAELLALRNDIEVVAIRGTIEERIAQVDNGTVDALIVATCALTRLGLSHRATERLAFETHPLQGNLAITASARVSDDIRSLFEGIDIRRQYGKVTLVGFGPGDPELITVKGQKALEDADVIFYDDLTNEPYIRRFRAEEIDYLKARMVSVEVVPGISSGIALASLTQIPLTHRHLARSVAFVLGHSAMPQTPDADTLIYYMGGEKLSTIAEALLRSGRNGDTAVALVTNVSLPEQRVVFSTLSELRYAVFRDTPVLIIVGEVVALESQSHHQRIYDTGTQGSTPLIRIERNQIHQPEASNFDWVVFTSRYGVRYYEKNLKGVKVASIGPVTSAELQRKGISPIFESPTQSAEGIIDFFTRQPVCRILLPRSDKGLRALSDGLRASGHEVVDLPVYRNTQNPQAEAHDLTLYDKVIFSSPSAVEAFKNIYANQSTKHLLIIAKGKTTYEAIQTI